MWFSVLHMGPVNTYYYPISHRMTQPRDPADTDCMTSSADVGGVISTVICLP